jgi:NADH:ubiquinone oxidoreductase subunit 6 (subunit J)
MLAAIILIATATVVFLQREIGGHALITLLGPVLSVAGVLILYRIFGRRNR